MFELCLGVTKILNEKVSKKQGAFFQEQIDLIQEAVPTKKEEQNIDLDLGALSPYSSSSIQKFVEKHVRRSDSFFEDVKHLKGK